MKKILFILCITGVMLTSCSDWLDVSPSDSISEEDLFKESTGFQNALNGVYEALSAQSLYGTELTFGLLDAMGQVYAFYGKDGEWAGIKDYHYYYQAGEFQYNANEDIKGAFEAIWEEGYKTIANCNNIIGKLEAFPAENFRYGEKERDMIKGEAIAARALMHFDLLRLFAPAPQADDGKLYIPYVVSYPYYGGQVPLTVTDAMEHIEADLKEALRLVSAYDTMDMAHNFLLIGENRFQTFQTFGFMEDESEIVMNAFYFFRGYRLNCLAIEALLARCYSWWGGDKMKLAFEHAEKVAKKEIDLGLEEKNVALSYTYKNLDKDRKFRADLIFGLSYPLLQEDYKGEYGHTESNSYLALGLYDKVWDYDLADGDDYRLKLIQDRGWDGQQPLKNIPPTVEDKIVEETKDIVPMFRLSELHFIMAEYYASIGDYTNAAKMINEVRVGRNCKGDVELGISDMKSFKERLFGEVRREFFQEGQTFFYYKKYGEPLVKGMNAELFIVPKPDSENVN